MSTDQPSNLFPWALDAADLALLADYLQATRPGVAVEFGSGKTTPVLRRYAGHTLSLEHLPQWGEKTEQLCASQRENWFKRLRDREKRSAELRVVDIGEITSPVGPLPVYETTLPHQIDFALIDGPPKTIGRQGAMFQLYPSLLASSVVWLDDVNRPEETEILAFWQQHFPLSVHLISERIAEIRIVTQ